MSCDQNIENIGENDEMRNQSNVGVGNEAYIIEIDAKWNLLST